MSQVGSQRQQKNPTLIVRRVPRPLRARDTAHERSNKSPRCVAEVPAAGGAGARATVGCSGPRAGGAICRVAQILRRQVLHLCRWRLLLHNTGEKVTTFHAVLFKFPRILILSRSLMGFSWLGAVNMENLFD